MGSLKSAEELFTENEEQYITNPTGLPFEEINYPTGYVPKDKFIQAIKAERQQFGEMIKTMYKKDSQQIGKFLENAYNTALTDILNKLQELK